MPPAEEQNPGALARGRARAAALGRRGQDWAESRDAATFQGVAVDAWKRYRAVDGPLQSALLSLYVMVAILPALIVIEEYLDPHPAALVNELVDHYGLSGQTAEVLRSVLVQSRDHHFGSALLAIVAALFFGLGFGRVLQLVHVRAWRVDLPRRDSDQWRYGVVLVGVYGLILVLLVQLAELKGDLGWARLVVAPGWVALLVLFFVWAPRLLTHKLISRRDLLPGAVLTGVGLVLLMLVSTFVMEPWVDLYAKDYGGFGVVMAIFFWLAFSSALIVGAAAISPALAERRALRRRPEATATA